VAVGRKLPATVAGSPLLWVLSVGTKVTINEVPAEVNAVSIYSDDHIEYRVVWWDGRKRVAEWVKSTEIKDCHGLRPIGFQNNDKQGQA